MMKEVSAIQAVKAYGIYVSVLVSTSIAVLWFGRGTVYIDSMLVGWTYVWFAVISPVYSWGRGVFQKVASFALTAIVFITISLIFVALKVHFQIGELTDFMYVPGILAIGMFALLTQFARWLAWSATGFQLPTDTPELTSSPTQ